MKIDYGPPAVGGVKHLQYLSDDADYLSSGAKQLARLVGLMSAATWGYAEVTENQTLKKKAMGVALASLLVELLIR